MDVFLRSHTIAGWSKSVFYLIPQVDSDKRFGVALSRYRRLMAVYGRCMTLSTCRAIIQSYSRQVKDRQRSRCGFVRLGQGIG